MNRQNFLKLTGASSLGLLLGIKIPKVEAAPAEEVFVSRPLTNITVEYMKKQQPWRIPFGQFPPLHPEKGDMWWQLGRYGHYEVTKYDGKTWKPVR